MKILYIEKDLSSEDVEAINLTEKIKKGLMTPDVITAMQAGCNFDMSFKKNEKSITVCLKSREKVSILKSTNGTPIGVILKK